MRVLISIALLALIPASQALAQGGDTLPATLPSADTRPIPATPGEARKLVGQLEGDRASLAEVQRESPTPGRLRTLQLLEEEIETIKRLDARRQELAAEAARYERASTEVEELRKRLAAVRQDEEALPDPADANADVALARDREATDELIREQAKRRDDAIQSREKLRLEQERVLRRLPMAKRDLHEAQVDLTDYETDSREAVAGGVAGEQARTMLEQVYLYRLRVAEHQAALDTLKYQAGEIADLLIDKASLESAFAEEKLQQLEARRNRIDALAETAAASRLERGRAERDLIATTAAGAPPWARPYWELKEKLAAINVDVADVSRKKRSVDTRICCGGAILSLQEEAADEAKNFERVDADKAEIEDVVPGTTRGLLQVIAQRESKVVRAQELQEELRALRKELRDLQRSVRSDDATSLSEEVAAARRLSAPPARVELEDVAEREASSPSSWEKLASALKAAAAERARLVDEYDKVLTKAGDGVRETRKTLEKNLLRYRSALLWTRDPSEISVEAIDRARGDLGQVPETVAHAASLATLSSLDWVGDRARAGRIGDLAMVFGSLVALLLLVVFVHRRASKKYAAAVAGSPDLTLSRAARLGATLLRNVEWTALVAFAGVVLPAIAGASRQTIAICAAVFTPPFFYRLARTLIELFFGAEGGTRGLFRMPEAAARLMRTTCVMLLRVCVCFVPLAILLSVTGYRERNPGLVELLWLLNAIGCYVVILVVLLRPSGIGTLLRRKGGLPTRATFLRAAVAAAYPVVIAAVIFLLVLRSLSYRVAVQYFLERFLISAAWIAGAVLLRRYLARILFGNEPRVAPPAQELASDRERYEAHGRRALADRLRRLAVTLLVFGPAVFFVLDAWGLTGAGWDAVFNRPLTFVSETLTLGDVLSAVVTAILAFLVVRSTRDLLRFAILPRTSLDVGVRYTIVTLTTYVLVALSAVVILGGQLKVEPAVIGGFVAALGLGLGFGLQEIINNFFSGLILLVERPLKVGDTIAVSGTVGRVDRINMRSTTLMTAENTGVIIPNKDLISSTVTNWSAGTPTIRESIALGIAYGSDTALFKQIVLEAVESHGLILKQPAPDIVFVGFGASSLDFSLRYWIRLTTPGSKVKSDLHFAFDSAFRKHGIEMPFPTQDVHVRSWKGPTPAGFEAEGRPAAGEEARVGDQG